jgi:hypothetical protein
VDLETEVVSDVPDAAHAAADPVTTERHDQPGAANVDAWWTGDLGMDEPADASLDDIWVPDDATAAPVDGTPPPGTTDDDPLVEAPPRDDDDRPESGTDAEDDAPADEPDAAPVFEVRRRASQRDGDNGGPANGRALLRTERSPVVDDAAPSEPSPSRATANADATDEHGLTLTAAEREARAARDRLSRFQRAVQQGRSQTRSRHNGGDHHDA